MLSLRIYGGQGRNRTADASLFRAALYQLSYLAMDPAVSFSIVTLENTLNSIGTAHQFAEAARRPFPEPQQHNANHDQSC